jgi:hypothetical protein
LAAEVVGLSKLLQQVIIVAGPVVLAVAGVFLGLPEQAARERLGKDLQGVPMLRLPPPMAVAAVAGQVLLALQVLAALAAALEALGLLIRLQVRL